MVEFLAHVGMVVGLTGFFSGDSAGWIAGLWSVAALGAYFVIPIFSAGF